MKLLWIVILIVATAPVTAGNVAAATAEPASAGADVGPQLDDIDARASQVQDLTARFEQQKFTALLKKPLVSSGRVRTKGSLVRWDTEVPDPAVLFSDGREIRLFYPRQRAVEIYPIDERLTDLAASPLPRLAALREHFEIWPAETPDAAGANANSDPRTHVYLRLRPKGEYLREHVDEVRVVLDARVPCLVSVEVRDADGDRTLIRFRDVKLNVGLKDADVAQSVPAGTKVSRPLQGLRGNAAGAKPGGSKRDRP